MDGVTTLVPPGARVGHVVTEAELEFVGVDLGQLSEALDHRCPLGMTADQFVHFESTLRQALAADDVTDADLRLQGSSAHYVSGAHKTMPWTRRELTAEIRAVQKRIPVPHELDTMERTLAIVWPPERPRPRRRPFDALHRLAVHREPSDYDVQISSDTIVHRAVATIEALGLPPEDPLVFSDTYAFVRKDLVDNVCPATYLWTLRQQALLQRPVTIAVFPTNGPPDRSAEHGELSAHFRDEDWTL